MTPLPSFPPAVIRYVGATFAKVNRRVSEKIALVPGCSEPSLDMTFIEQVSRHAAPKVVAPGWAVRMDVHYLGGMRHFYGWEIADIGVLIFARKKGKTVAKKVALLQSKRLYPTTGSVHEETPEDFRIGFGTLLPGSSSLPSLATSHTYQFTNQSKYQALHAHDDQYDAIEEYEKEIELPVHYLLYNPWFVPVTYTFPHKGPLKLGPKGNGGCRVVPSVEVRNLLKPRPKGYSPSFAEFSGLVSTAQAHLHGWRLEFFMAQLLMKCKQGALFEGVNQDNIYSLFNRRSGPIAAAVAVTVEQFGD